MIEKELFANYNYSLFFFIVIWIIFFLLILNHFIYNILKEIFLYKFDIFYTFFNLYDQNIKFETEIKKTGKLSCQYS